jgi:CRISPR-associated protein Cmr3
LPLLPVLKSGRGKPLGGCWLSENGWREYLQGHIPKGQDIVWRDALWKSETRPGIALDGTTRTGAEGALYSVEHVSLKAGIGFLAGFRCGETDWPEHGNLRLAGDGRVAQWSRIQWAPPEPPLDAIAATRRFRLVLATHGLFPDGWLPPGIDRATFALVGPGFSARLVCAAVVRSELVSGWDLFKNEPKPARRAVPAGSVYWFDNFEGDADKLAAWAKDGLWPDNDWEEPRRAEGWNRAWLAAWPGA